MSKNDYLTHLALAAGFLGILAPYVAHSGLSFGSGLYLAGTSAQVLIASASRVFGSRRAT